MRENKKYRARYKQLCSIGYLFLLALASCLVEGCIQPSLQKDKPPAAATIVVEQGPFVIPDTSGRGGLVTVCLLHPDPKFSRENFDETSECGFEVRNNGVIYDFGTYRRAVEKEYCDMKLKTWKRLFKGADKVCAMGWFVDPHEVAFRRSLIFHRVETENGCDSYFEGECPAPMGKGYPSAIRSVTSDSK